MKHQNGENLATKEIRLQYSGFVIFAAKMLSVVTGIIFQLMIARSLLPMYEDEYDAWFNLNDVLAYFTVMSGVFSFWAMRFAAREKEGAIKTGISVTLTISLVATLLYLLLIPWIIPSLGVSDKFLPVYFLVSIQVIEVYSIGILEAGLQARIPQMIGYGLIVQQICKVILGYVLLVEYNQLLLGAVVTTMVAFAIQTIYYFKLLVKELKQRIRWEYAREWLKGSLVNMYNVVGSQIAAYIFIMLYTLGGEGARGRLGAAAIVVNVITYSSFLAYALYPKLLAERKREDITTSLKMVLMFAIPMTVGAMVLSDSYITILTDIYRDAAPVLVVLAIDALIATISGVFSSVLLGIESVDERAKISFKELAKSRLFIAFSFPYVHAAITLPVAYYALTTYANNQPLQAALSVSIINSSARFIIFIFLYIIVRKMVKIDIPWMSTAKYVFASAVMATVLFIVPHPTRISTVLAVTVFGGCVYLALLMAIDQEARALPKTIWQEIRRKQGTV